MGHRPRISLHHVAYFGTDSSGYDGILPGSRFHGPDCRPYERDLDKAKRLVEESGLDQPIELLGPTTPDPVKQRTTQTFQANAAEIGVTVNAVGIWLQ